ncbi:MAG: PA14 domain-containing protein [Candidatus Pseudobacter hemicellulosilyticus]|uniref:PA14 domain-containing protein n=1 Tax=Candidatus Pseudobacter hemicellulosilyticus TaxID=3121375 RepID=A0AAJ6BI64_9BACT|nr:MAG: PA14 domain-containing protein [Pseudobacter sp.]
MILRLRSTRGGSGLPVLMVVAILLLLITAFKPPLSSRPPAVADPPGRTLSAFGNLPDTVPSQEVSFSFTLAQSRITSAGVYTADSVLVRTLWSNVRYPAGTHTGVWDGTTDEAQLAGNGTYYIKVISSNASYTWEGTIGNTSDADTGITVQRGLKAMNAMIILGNYAYYTKAYSETSPSQYKMHVDTPGRRIRIQPTGTSDQATEFIATDGVNVYWAGPDGRDTLQSFVFVTAVSNNADVLFPAGVALKMKVGRTYPSTLDTSKITNASITGLAVQVTGSFFLTARSGQNRVRVLSKTTGGLVNTFTLTNPGVMIADSSNNIWITHTASGVRKVEQFSVDNAGNLSSTGISFTGATDPMAISLVPGGQTLVVADAGNHQLKAFSTATGAAEWSYGLAGGYANGPDVSNDKFYWRDARGKVGAFIAFEADSSFWVGDVGNNRVQHYSWSRSFLNRMQYIQGFYNCNVDGGDSSRVFAEYLEYHIDYSKPLGHNNGSWELVKNWGYTVRAFRDDTYNRMKAVNTLPNGRTYAMFIDDSLATKKWEIAELPATGNLRFTGVSLTYDYSLLYPDGSLRKMPRRIIGQPIILTRRPLTGFTAAFNPQWGSAATIATTPSFTGRDPGFGGNTNKLRTGEMTSTNVNLLFDGGGAADGYNNYHLGGIKTGATQWLWRTALSTKKDYTGPFPTDGSYDIGNNVEYSGVSAMAAGRHIFWGYHGEFWKNSQTNKWHHVYDNGLLVAQFGITGPEVAGRESYPEMAGNAFSAAIVRMNADSIYLYHNDEGHHGGIHRWLLSGLSTVQEQVIPVTFTVGGKGLMAAYYNEPRLNNFYHAGSRVDSMVYIHDLDSIGVTNASRFSVIWTGYVQPQYSEKYIFYASANKGVRLFVGDSLLVDTVTASSSGEYSDTIPLQAALRYPVRMEVYQDGGTASAGLSWSSPSLAKSPIPPSRFTPAAYPDYSGGYDLLERLPYYTTLKHDLYGWKRDTVVDEIPPQGQYTPFWRAFTNLKGYNTRHPNLNIQYQQKDMDTNTVTRQLGPVIPGLSNWTLSGIISYNGNSPNEGHRYIGTDGSGGSFLELLDDNGKILLRFFWNMNYDTKVTRLFVNNIILDSAHDNTMKLVYGIPQELEVSMQNDSVRVKYGPYPVLTVPKLEAAAVWNRLGHLRYYCWTKTFNSLRQIDFISLHYTTSTGVGGSSQKQVAQVLDLLPERTAKRFGLYPNPLTGTVFYVKVPAKAGGQLRIQLTDLSGKTVFLRRVNAPENSDYPLILPQPLPPGVYVVSINNQYTEKLLVR